MLQLHMRTTDAAVILQAEGRLEVGSAVTVLRQATTRAVGPGVQTLELDLAGVTAIDAAGVGALVNTKIYCDRAGGRLVLLRAGLRVHRVLSLCGLDHVFEMIDSESPPPDTLPGDSRVRDKASLLLGSGRRGQRSHLESTVAVV